MEEDPILPSLLSITEALKSFSSGHLSGSDLSKLLSDCIHSFKDNPLYRDDSRFLKIWFLYMGFVEDYDAVFLELLDKQICHAHSLVYVYYASFLESKAKLYEADAVYRIAIKTNVEPSHLLTKAHALFLHRMSLLASSPHPSHINPWSDSTIKALLKQISPRLLKFDGYHATTKPYSGKVALSSLRKSSRNKIIEIGRTKYQIMGYAGQGGFAEVYKAYVNSNLDEVVALKIQKPDFPWEFYMYRELDKRISDKERSRFGVAQEMHTFSDCSILACDYIANGTLQDAINSFAVTGKSMDEELCIYYTIEMLYMLETLHNVGIIHGDFKPDNLLIRYSRDFLPKDGCHDINGLWRDQGLCLVDWGRGIDLRLFPENTEFKGDCRTSGFRCIEMEEKKPWKFQVDMYGLCVIVHMMLHNTYMEIDKKPSPDGGYVYQPKASFKRYWKVELWKNFFAKLLNSDPHCKDKNMLQNLRESFQEYISSDPHHLRKLSDLLAKQRKSMCSA